MAMPFIRRQKTIDGATPVGAIAKCRDGSLVSATIQILAQDMAE